MSTKQREVIWGGAIMGAEIRANDAGIPTVRGWGDMVCGPGAASAGATVSMLDEPPCRPAKDSLPFATGQSREETSVAAAYAIRACGACGAIHTRQGFLWALESQRGALRVD
jgi:hypothetical protein